MLASPSPFEQALEELTCGATNDTTLHILSKASRESEDSRKRFAEAPVLEALIDVVSNTSYGSSKLLEPALRCIGNACADNDAARDIVTSHGFTWVRYCLRESTESIGLLTTKVLFNICSDHEASQQQCYRDGIHLDLIDFLHSGSAKHPTDDTSVAIDLLFWISGQKATIEPEMTSPWPKEVLTALLDLPQRYEDAEVGDFSSLVESVLCYVRDLALQKQIITDDVFPLLASTERQPLINRIRALNPGSEQDAEDLKLLLPLGTSLVWCLSDIAAHSDFAKAYPLDHKTIRSLIELVQERRESSWAEADPGHLIKAQNIMFMAACQVIGNLLWQMPPETYGFLVYADHLHGALFAEIARSPDTTEGTEMMHSIAGLLRHLTRPSPDCREVIGSEHNCRNALEKLCRHTMEQLRKDGGALLRALGKDCPKNQERFAELGAEVMVALIEEQKKTADNEPS